MGIINKVFMIIQKRNRKDINNEDDNKIEKKRKFT